MRRILYIAPTQIRRTGIADYATAYRAALTREGTAAVDMLADLPGAVESIGRDLLLAEASTVARRAISSGALARYDLLHVELGTELYPEFFVAHEIVRRLRIPLVLTVHDAPFTVKNLQPFWNLAPSSALPLRILRKLLNLTIGRWYERDLMRRTDVVLVLSERARTAVAARLNPRRVEVLPHLVLRDQPATVRARWDGSAPLRVLFFGFLYPPKGVHHLVEAVARLAERPEYRSRLRLSICGSTASGDSRDEYSALLQRMVSERDIGDIVKMEGFVPAERVSTLMSTHEVMVLPYLEARELSMSGPLIQAMSYGLVPIVTPVRAMAEVVQDEVSGFVVPAGNASAIADRLERLIASPSLLSSMGQQAQSSIARSHGWTAVATRAAAIYDSLA